MRNVSSALVLNITKILGERKLFSPLSIRRSHVEMVTRAGFLLERHQETSFPESTSQLLESLTTSISSL